LDAIRDGFHLPLSTQAHEEFLQLQSLMSDVTLSDQEHDTWTTRMGKGIYKPSPVYHQHFNLLANHVPSGWLWKSKCTAKHIFFCLAPST
jgi:hypothetical protein